VEGLNLPLEFNSVRPETEKARFSLWTKSPRMVSGVGRGLIRGKRNGIAHTKKHMPYVQLENVIKQILLVIQS